ncbi:unnamed protein product [Heligmosomoides polygyrus]|uniref:DUF4968 domain-containing protein n=1 Tax=Heligmosomoides polygyrus TaxID=6339 RepID=A0A3P8BIC2_HELPZ|nr:unnamed protein product [Heligmosomoides polygyrus]
MWSMTLQNSRDDATVSEGTDARLPSPASVLSNTRVVTLNVGDKVVLLQDGERLATASRTFLAAVPGPPVVAGVHPDQAFDREKWVHHTRIADPATKRANAIENDGDLPNSMKLKRAAWMANTYWQKRELKIITTCANSSCKCDAGFNLVDFRQKNEHAYNEMLLHRELLYG